MSTMRRKFVYPIPEGMETERTYMIANHVFRNTKNGYVIVVHKIVNDHDIFNHIENQYYLYFEETERNTMLTELIHEFEYEKSRGFTYTAYRYKRDITNLYSILPKNDKNEFSALRIELITTSLGEAVEKAKRIKELL